MNTNGNGKVAPAEAMQKIGRSRLLELKIISTECYSSHLKTMEAKTFTFV